MTEDIILKIQKWFDKKYAGQPIKTNSPKKIMSEMVDMVRDELKKEINKLGEPMLNITFIRIMQFVEKNMFYIKLIGDLETRLCVSAPILCVILHRTKNEWKMCSCGSYDKVPDSKIKKIAKNLRNIKEE